MIVIKAGQVDIGGLLLRFRRGNEDRRLIRYYRC